MALRIRNTHYIISHIITLIFLFINVRTQMIYTTSSRITPTNINQNLLRITSSSINSQPCLIFNNLSCTKCNQGYVLTNGKCYENIPFCINQYTNICTLCQSGFGLKTVYQTGSTALALVCVNLNSTINNTSVNNSNTSTNVSTVNPVVMLGKQSFISWLNIEVRYPTDIYLVMIWNYIDGTEDLNQKVKIQDNVIQMAIQGKVKQNTDDVTLLQWAIDNQFNNFNQGNIIDIDNVYFYRVRFQNRNTKNVYEILAMIHQVNYKVTLLQYLNINISNGTNGTVSSGNQTQTQSQQIKSLQQQLLDFKLQSSRQRLVSEERQVQLLIFMGYSMLLQQTISSDFGCLLIKKYFQQKFSQFLKLIQAPSSTRIYTELNFQIQKSNRLYIYSISFNDNVRVMVSFNINKWYQMEKIEKVYIR